MQTNKSFSRPYKTSVNVNTSEVALVLCIEEANREIFVGIYLYMHIHNSQCIYEMIASSNLLIKLRVQNILGKPIVLGV